MHPAKSVIFFTTTSGAGYGLLFLGLLLAMTGQLPAASGAALAAYGIAFVLIIAGLLSSTFHLGHPERAWRALSQWRSSWLSREGVFAVFGFLPTTLFVAAGLLGAPPSHPAMLALGMLGLFFCAATVWCTAMIYTSLKPVFAWCNGFVPAAYLGLALATGGLVLQFVLQAANLPSQPLSLALPVAILTTLGVKWGYWRRIDGSASPSTPETATGLGAFGRVRLVEAPHSQANYLMQEMVFQVARSHAEALRRATYVLLFAAPLVLSLLTLVLSGGAATVCAGLAVLSAGAGVATERWLFFAEARHTVGLYYGQKAA